MRRFFPRKLLTLCTAAAVALTGLQVTPAQAEITRDEWARILAGAATVVILGAALDNAHKQQKREKKKDKPKKKQVYHKPAPKAQSHHWNKHGYQPPRHTHTQHAHLPRHCVMYVPKRHGGEYRTLSRHCLKRHYPNVRALPKVCRESVKLHGDWRAAFKIRCLKDKGYRLARY
ncbi:hypothetical protein [Pseudaestuariivita sp.]|uniref:hypothetical protein n=1 Tax=Pseudaestuariivita sp. TaxID=2211669 RepID=UPI004059FA3B